MQDFKKKHIEDAGHMLDSYLLCACRNLKSHMDLKRGALHPSRARTTQHVLMKRKTKQDTTSEWEDSSSE